MLPFLLVAGAVSAALCVAELCSLRYRRLAWARRAESFRDFQGHFRRSAIDPEVLLAVQEFFDEVTSMRAFPVRPGDDLLGVYGLQVEDVHDAVAVIASGAHCLSPRVLEPAARDAIATVADLVYAVHRIHRQAAADRGVAGRPVLRVI
jgi:hypothetical protein